MKTREPVKNRKELNRRDFLKKCATLGGGAFLFSHTQPAYAISPEKPNIVLIMADDIGYECFGTYGGVSYETPELDALAASGMRFEHCYSQPLCTPSRVKIMTGRSNNRNYIYFGEFKFGEKTFGHILKEEGYAACIAGKWQLEGRGAEGPYDAGFDEYCLWHMEDAFGSKKSRYLSPKMIRNGEILTDMEDRYGPDVACDHLLDFVERNRDRPFLAYFPMILVHNPFCPTPDSAEWGQDVTANRFFADMVAYMDKLVGRVVRKLEDLGLREKTLFLFTGDNGTNKNITSEMGDGSTIEGGKNTTTDAGTRVPLIANWPGTIAAGGVCDDLVDFSDFLPTMAEAAGATLPVDVTLDGRSFLPQLRGESGNPRDWIYIWYQRNPPDSTLYRFARDRRWKLYDAGDYNRAGNLYDVASDPLENTPVPPGDPEADAAREKLSAALGEMRLKSAARQWNRY